MLSSLLGNERVPIDQTANALRDLIGDAGDDHAGIAVADQDNVLQILRCQIVYDRLDSLGEPGGFGIAGPVAGDRRCVHNVAGGSDRRRRRLKLRAGVPSAMDKHVSCHLAFLPEALALLV